jgi:hypothetical protein
MNESSKSTHVSGALRIEFSDGINPEILKKLHLNCVSGDIPQEIKEFLKTPGVSKMSPVYKMSQDEIDTDKYGFSREFLLYLKESSDQKEVFDLISCSPLIKKVQNVNVVHHCT